MLLDKIQAVTQQALGSGALLPIETESGTVSDAGVHFLLRRLSSLKHKEAAAKRLKQAGETRTNPFLPYDPALYVADAGPDHVCLLNKFNVIDNHILIVTRTFESQQALLNLSDFNALAGVLQSVDGLAFYNGGTLAGASQPHKHLQLIPLCSEAASLFPFTALYDAACSDTPGAVPALRFRHLGLALDTTPSEAPDQIASRLLSAYQQLRTALNLDDDAPYNLLVTRRWMVMVPRTQEHCAGVSFNALAFAGTLLVRNQDDAERLKTYGLMNALTAVT